MPQNSCGLYLISPPAFEWESYKPQLASALEAIQHSLFKDNAAFQLRLKNTDDNTILNIALKTQAVCRDHNIPFIMNDRLDLAKIIKPDGLHLGQEDGAALQDYLQTCRDALGEDAVLGVSCQDSKHKAMIAAEAGADYVSFGAFYPTASKETSARPSPEILSEWSKDTTIPCVAIGGITPKNCAPLVQSGADFLAVISAIWNHADGPAEAVKAFASAVEAA